MVSIALCLAGLLTGCGSDPVVGVLLPTSGSGASYGESIESGIRLAITQARELDQVPPGLQVEWANSGSDPEQAVSELYRLVNEKGIKMVIGGAISGEAQAMLPALEDLRIICLSPSASLPSLTKDSKYFFRLFPSDELEGNAAGKFLRDRMKKENALLYVGDNEYTRGFEPEFVSQYQDNLGGKIVGRVNLTEDQWQEQSKAQLASNPEAVYIIGYTEQILEALRHLREQQYEGAILTTSAFYSANVIQKAGELADGLIFPLPPFDITSEEEPIVSFVQRYMDIYQMAPDTYAAHGYDAMRLTMEIMRLANPPETSQINKALHFGLMEFVGVTGPILFDDHGDVKHYPKMFIVKEGKVQSYQRYMKAERERILREVQKLLDKD
jgi:branched-chain amino acid transport system substrate-binding protein